MKNNKKCLKKALGISFFHNFFFANGNQKHREIKQLIEVNTSHIFLFADKSSCNKFYECSNGTAFSKACADGLVWNTAKSECDLKDLTNCGMRPITIQPRGGSAEIAECGCPHGQKSCYQMNPTSCNGFIHCSAGKRYQQMCPRMYFNGYILAEKA